MSTWAALFADIRTDLNDTTGTNPRWSDSLLLLFAKDAVRAYSIDLPRIVYREELSAENGSFLLPSGLISIIGVEMPEGVYLDRFQPKPGKRTRLPNRATAYFSSGDKLYLNVAPTNEEAILLSYKAYYGVPTDVKSTTVIDLPAGDEELLRLFVKAKISEQMRMGQSSLDRFKPAGTRDDNPLLPEHNELMKEFHLRIAQRLGGVIPLNRGSGRFS